MSRCKKIVENIGHVCPRITPDTLICPLIHAQKYYQNSLKQLHKTRKCKHSDFCFIEQQHTQ